MNNIDEALGAIEKWIGTLARRQVEAELAGFSHPEKLTLNTQLDLAGYWHALTNAEVQRRAVVKALSLIVIVRMEVDRGQQTNFIRSLYWTGEAELVRRLKTRLGGERLVQRISLAQQRQSRNAWAPTHFTDPLQHDTKKFVYLVHAMRRMAGIGQLGKTPSEGELKRVDFLRSRLGDYLLERKQPTGVVVLELSSAKLYFENPTAIRQEMLSCSVISDAHARTYGDFSFGFVLKAPQQNICVASSSDLAISNSTARGDMLAMISGTGGRVNKIEDFLDTLVGMYETRLPTPTELLTESVGGHNEVVVLGSFGGCHAVSVVGIFVKVMPGTGEVWDTALKMHLLIGQCSRRLNLPIVPIIDGSGTSSGWRFFDVFRREGKKHYAVGLSSIFTGHL